MLFVEVKGGSLSFDGKEWLRKVGDNYRSLNKDPFAQAQRGMHNIMGLVRRRFPGSGGKLPFTYGFAVAFPDCRIVGKLPPSIRRELILDAANLQNLREVVDHIFSVFGRQNHRTLDTHEIESVREALYPKYHLVPVTWRKIEDQEERLRRLTNDQQRILGVLANQSKAAIEGIAGSGKTILAMAKAQAMARDGRRALFLCYNRPLADWLRNACSESIQQNLIIDTYHGLTHKLCKAANVREWMESKRKDRKFWVEETPEALMQACDQLGSEHKFDAVIVDEGQDFHDLWWTSLDSIFRDPDNKICYYAFYDPKQSLYVDTPSLPSELGVPFNLPENCRNTIRIAEHCAALADYENRHRSDAPLGDAPEEIEVRTLPDAIREAGKRVRTLCMPNLERLKMSQVVVLTPGLLSPGFTKEKWSAHFNPIPVSKEFDQWERNQCVLVASWNRFKGLEADAVVTIETSGNNDAKASIERYVARSRAKHLLTVIRVKDL